MFVITLGPGNVDLSIPSTMVLSGTVALKAMNGDATLIPLGLALAIGVGLVVGFANFGLIKLLRIPPIIATLSSSLIILSTRHRVEPGTPDRATGRAGQLHDHQRLGGAGAGGAGDPAGARHARRAVADHLRAFGHRHRPEPARRDAGRREGGARALHQLCDVRHLRGRDRVPAGVLLGRHLAGHGRDLPADLHRRGRHRWHIGRRRVQQRARACGARPCSCSCSRRCSTRSASGRARGSSRRASSSSWSSSRPASGSSARRLSGTPPATGRPVPVRRRGATAGRGRAVW